MMTMSAKPVPFSKRLTAVRKSAGITMYELAKRSGVSKQVISTLESGQHVPNWETVRKLARALGVSVAAFDEGNP